MIPGRINLYNSPQGLLEIHQIIDSLNNHNKEIINSKSPLRVLTLKIFQGNSRLLIIIEYNRLLIIEILSILTSSQMIRDHSRDLNRLSRDLNRHSRDLSSHSRDLSSSSRDNRLREENLQE